MPRDTVLVLDDDAVSLSPFFVELLRTKGYRVRAIERWGDAVSWLHDGAEHEKASIGAVVLDIIFALDTSDEAAFESSVGRPFTQRDCMSAGAELLPYIGIALPAVSVLVLSNSPFHLRRGQQLRHSLLQYGQVAGIFAKPAQEDFFSLLDNVMAQRGGEGG